MANYDNGLVYKIQHNSIDELLYVGSTTEFTKRKSHHKFSSKNVPSKLYVMIRENGGWENFTMTLVKYFPCNTKRELEAEEEKVRRELNASLNSIRSLSSFAIYSSSRSTRLINISPKYGSKTAKSPHFLLAIHI